MVRRWEHYEHEADIGIRGYGDSVNDAFVAIAMGLTAVVTDPDRVRDSVPVTIECTAPDIELLLVDWLNALVYEMSTRRFLFSRFEVSIDSGQLHATAWGEPVEPARHLPAVEVKGATYTTLRVSQADDGQWCVQCVVDV